MERKEGRGEEPRIILDPRRSSVYKETRAGRDRKFQVSKEAHTALSLSLSPSLCLSLSVAVTDREMRRAL